MIGEDRSVLIKLLPERSMGSMHSSFLITSSSPRTSSFHGGTGRCFIDYSSEELLHSFLLSLSQNMKMMLDVIIICCIQSNCIQYQISCNIVSLKKILEIRTSVRVVELSSSSLYYSNIALSCRERESITESTPNERCTFAPHLQNTIIRLRAFLLKPIVPGRKSDQSSQSQFT